MPTKLYLGSKETKDTESYSFYRKSGYVFDFTPIITYWVPDFTYVIGVNVGSWPSNYIRIRGADRI